MQPFVDYIPGNLLIISTSYRLCYMILIWILNLHARLYQKLSEYQEKVPLCQLIDFIDFICNWQQLCNAWVLRYKTWLTLCKKFVLHEAIKQRLNAKSFKDFTEDSKKSDWAIIFYQIFTLVFMDWYYVIFFRVFRENTFL